MIGQLCRFDAGRGQVQAPGHSGVFVGFSDLDSRGSRGNCVFCRFLFPFKHLSCVVSCFSILDVVLR